MLRLRKPPSLTPLTHSPLSFREEQEQICRDLVQALSTPRPVSRSQGLFSPESSVNNNEADTIKDELFQSVLSRLRGMQQS
jgi:hypothetical protein